MEQPPFSSCAHRMVYRSKKIPCDVDKDCPNKVGKIIWRSWKVEPEDGQKILVYDARGGHEDTLGPSLGVMVYKSYGAEARQYYLENYPQPSGYTHWIPTDELQLPKDE